MEDRKLKIFSIFNEDNYYEVCVYCSLKEFTNGIEWMDIMDGYFIIMDSQGNLYKWDDSKKEEFATINDYSLKVYDKNLDLCKIYLKYYELNEFANEFNFKI